MLPRAFLPRWVRRGESDDEIRAQMAHETDFSERAWIATSDEKPVDHVNGPGVLTTRRTPHGYEIDADIAGGGWVVVSETAWTGWRAWIDGRPVRTQIANTAFLSVYVTPGRHHVRLQFLPRSFVAGRAITLATLALLGIVFLRHSLAQRVG